MVRNIAYEVDFQVAEYGRRVDRVNREAWKFQDVRGAGGSGLRERFSSMLVRPLRSA